MMIETYYLKNEIDRYLEEHESINNAITLLAKSYKLSDFVVMTQDCRESIDAGHCVNGEQLTGCLYAYRDDRLLLNLDSVDFRLVTEYLDFLYDLMADKEIEDKVFYIVAFHYLNLGKHVGYNMTRHKHAPFGICGEEMFPAGARNLELISELWNGNMGSLIDIVSKDDVFFFNDMLDSLGYTFHSTKHFSLIAEFVGFESFCGRYSFDRKIKPAIDAFAFRYVAALATHEQGFCAYIGPDEQEAVKRELRCGFDIRK